MGEFNVAVIQMDCELAAWGVNLAKIDRLVSQYKDCDLIVFPEMIVTGYSVASFRDSVIQSCGEYVDELESIAASNDAAILVGMPEKDQRQLFNAVGFFAGRSGLVGTYRKSHLYADEKTIFAPGNELSNFDVWADSGQRIRFGVEICYDLEFPEVSRALSSQGVQVLCVSSANMDPWSDYHRIYAQARAMENQVFVLYCNRIGRESETRFCGGSAIIAPNGAVYESGNDVDECVLRASIDVGEISRMRNSSIPYWTDRRPDLYETVEMGR